MNVDIPLTLPQKQFCASKAKNPAIIGGLGCMRGDTRIHTEIGLIRICDLDSSIRVLSWNEKSQEFQLSLSSASFPKGKANLYRIETTQGVFEASGHHRVFSSQGKYRLVQDLALGDTLKASPFLSCSIKGSDSLSLPLSVPHYSKTDVDLMAHCATEARRCGLQLLSEEESARFYSPSLGDALLLSRTSDLYALQRMDDQAEQKPKHNHLDQSFGHTEKLGYSRHTSGLVIAEGDQTLTSSVVHTLHYHRKSELFREMFEHHHTAEKSSFDVHSYKNLNSYSTEAAIISISVSEVEETYWDLQVLDTNNYVCENGLIHHNSGKSRAGTMRLIALLLSDKGANGGYYMPSYDLLKLRAMPGVEEDLDMIGIPYTVNKSSYTITLHGFGNIIFRSYDRPERIIAYETAHSVVDELDTLPKEKASLVWRKITERNRQKRKNPNTIACVTTPDQGFSGFIYEKWVKKRQDGYEIIKAPTTSNPYLPDDYVQQIRDNYDPLLAEMYINGDFVSLSDKKVYHFFDRNKHHNPRVDNGSDHLHISIDFNVGGCCSNVWVIDGKKPIAVDEFVSHDTQDFVNLLTKKFKGRRVSVYPDASGKSRHTNSSATDIDIIRQGGFAVNAPDANPFIRDRINAFNALFAHDNIGINCDKCPELANALEIQGYTEKGDPEKFNDHPAIDDWVDSSGYFIHRRFQIKRLIAGPKWG